MADPRSNIHCAGPFNTDQGERSGIQETESTRARVRHGYSIVKIPCKDLAEKPRDN